MSSSAPPDVAAPDVAALVERFFRRRGEGRRISVDEVLAEAGANPDTQTRAALIDTISRRARSSSFRSTLSLESPSEAAEVAIEAPPTDIPGYDLIEEIGRGGMGAVYEAYQQSTGRRVAVKLISQEIARSEAARRRFEREVELVARLQHPNIVSVLDSGIHQGRYFYVMEYVEGAALDAFLAKVESRRAGTKNRKVEIGEVLGLVARIGDAVEYAHQRGVLHRDLKPSNILVAEVGAVSDRDSDAALRPSRSEPAPTPKILDFGLAKDIDPLAGERRALTLAEPGQILGTLAYMAPEQARGAHDEISVRSDVYSLGAIAYEAVTGRLPCSTDGALHDVLEHIQRQDPPRPSSLLDGIGPDVDAILLKALDKAPGRRYATAGELASDLRRWLSDEPVAARPATTFYQLRKFARRNKVLVGGIIGTTAALAVGFVVSLTLYFRAETARAEAQRLQQETERVAEFQAQMLTGIDAEKMGRGLVESLRAEAAAALQRRGEPAEQIQAKLATLEDLFVGLNPTNVAVKNLDENIVARAERTVEQEFADQPLIRAKLLYELACALRTLGLLERARSTQIAALDIYRRVLGDAHPRTVWVSQTTGSLLLEQRKLVEAEPHFRRALEGYRRLHGDDHADTANALQALATLMSEQGKLTEAESFCREAMERCRRLAGDDDLNTLASMNNLGVILVKQGKLPEAESCFREFTEKWSRRYGPDDRDTLGAMQNMASVLEGQGKLADAEHYWRHVLQARRRTQGDAHPMVAICLWSLANVQQARGNLDDAEQTYHESLVLYRKLRGEENSDVADILHALGTVRQAKGDLSAAKQFFTDAVTMRRKVLGEAHSDTRASASALADVYHAWHVAEPGNGFDATAAEWRAKLAEWQASTQSARNDDP